MDLITHVAPRVSQRLLSGECRPLLFLPFMNNLINLSFLPSLLRRSTDSPFPAQDDLPLSRHATRCLTFSLLLLIVRINFRVISNRHKSFSAHWLHLPSYDHFAREYWIVNWTRLSNGSKKEARNMAIANMTIFAWEYWMVNWQDCLNGPKKEARKMVI